MATAKDTKDKVQLFNPNDSVTGRDGGPYLDIEQAKAAEKVRAQVEGREPDLDNPPAFAGIPLVNAGQLAQTYTVNNLPSQEDRSVLPFEEDLAKRVKDNDNPLTVMVTADAPTNAAADENPTPPLGAGPSVVDQNKEKAPATPDDKK